MNDREFVGGFLLQTLLPRSPMAFARNSKPGGWGRAYARDIEAYQHVADLWIVGEDLPQECNAMTLDPQVRDQDGLPVARIFHVDHADDVAKLRRAWQVSTPTQI